MRWAAGLNIWHGCYGSWAKKAQHISQKAQLLNEIEIVFEKSFDWLLSMREMVMMRRSHAAMVKVARWESFSSDYARVPAIDHKKFDDLIISQTFHLKKCRTKNIYLIFNGAFRLRYEPNVICISTNRYRTTTATASATPSSSAKMESYNS